MRARDLPLKERFDKNVLIIPFTDCHLWTGELNKDGYGRIGWDRKMDKAHRVSFRLYKGDIPNGYSIRHTCDLPYCVNPAHLILGTHADNMRDKALRGHFMLSNETIKDIRARLSNGERLTALAVEFGVSVSYIHMVKTRKTRKYI